MKFKVKYVLLSIFIVVGITFFAIIYWIADSRAYFEAKPGSIDYVEFVLVKSLHWGFVPTDIVKPNAAILITDKKEIDLNQQLFLADQYVQHACGYDYEIQFWHHEDSLSNSVEINHECEIFSYKPLKTWRQFKKYKKLLATKPTHYIYILKLLAETDVSVAKNTLRELGFIILPFETYDKYRSLLLINPSDDLEEVKNKLKQYEFISEIKEYIDTQIYSDMSE